VKNTKYIDDTCICSSISICPWYFKKHKCGPNNVVCHGPLEIYGPWAIYLIIQINFKSTLMKKEFSLI
jgi:hypothetical protein